LEQNVSERSGRGSDDPLIGIERGRLEFLF
jgi:hypothetical protein